MHPTLFSIPAFVIFGRSIGPVTFHTYGTIMAIAFLVSLMVVSRQARRSGLEVERTIDLAVFTLIAGLIGARLMLAVVEWTYFRQHPIELFSLLTSGGVFYGGFLGALPVTAWYIRRHRLPVWKTVDVLFLALVLGQAIGRLGCLTAGCCYGHPTDAPWAIVFTSVEARRKVGTPLNVPLHPSQIYESLACLAIFGILLWLSRRKVFHGQVALAYVWLYSATRFGLEYFRGDTVRGLVRLTASLTLSTSQLVSAGLLVASFLVLPYLIKTQRIEQPPGV